MGETTFSKLKENYFVYFALLLVAIFALAGKPVPYSNDYGYLLQLAATYNPDLLANDITFSSPANERWLFNHVFGVFTLLFSIEFVGWAGRIFCWSGLLIALLRFGKRWGIPNWLIGLSVFIWVWIGQSIVSDEWMFGGFEAKSVAYICLLFALDRFCDGRDVRGAILLGLTFSFHPIIGLWGICGALLAMFIQHRDVLRTLKVGAVAGVFSLGGLIPLLIMQAKSISATTENLKYLQLVKFPFHFDPFSWAKSSVLLLILLLVFCFVAHSKTVKQVPNILIFFLAALSGFFLMGILLRVFDQYALLGFMPMRLFSVFAPLFFLFYMAKGFHERQLKSPVLLAILVPIVLLGTWTGIAANGYAQIDQTIARWNDTIDDNTAAFDWLRIKTAKDAIVIAPPSRNDFWWRSKRAQIVSYNHPIYSNLGEWQRRLELLGGKAGSGNKPLENEDIQKSYNSIPQVEMEKIAKEFKARYLISEADYSLPVVFTKGNVKIYEVPVS